MIYTSNRKIKALINRTTDILFPPQCFSCRRNIESQGSLCSTCWEAIEFITTPQCNICGTPFELAAQNGSICGSCIASPPLFTNARSVFCYNDKSSRIITDFKYYDKTHNCKYFAAWLLRTGNELIEKSDIITSVPLHKIRLLGRRYNQSALLCNSLGKLAEKQVNNELIIRHKHTRPQAGLTFKTRIKNVKHAFKVNKKFVSEIDGKNILLIDDVITTGSTIDACTKTLLRAGASNVFVLTLAMTVKN
ncbi:MAG: ComF family protein [Rickettsiales bacterium]|nr:ComF family protein [Pseudomonadota bacterium]MDA0966923.1 ComF family protein [Pseudomonadota bacterium]MDG4543842.1 ComF family protein [Rickettsiales bacterium]MDG4545988.1 ComF family protein [Rickettsiales bacterium]MDG4548234.1 ComF family protein [Rickettsiales bacterium]